MMRDASEQVPYAPSGNAWVYSSLHLCTSHITPLYTYYTPLSILSILSILVPRPVLIQLPWGSAVRAPNRWSKAMPQRAALECQGLQIQMWHDKAFRWPSAKMCQDVPVNPSRRGKAWKDSSNHQENSPGDNRWYIIWHLFDGVPRTPKLITSDYIWLHLITSDYIWLLIADDCRWLQPSPNPFAVNPPAITASTQARTWQNMMMRNWYSLLAPVKKNAHIPCGLGLLWDQRPKQDKAVLHDHDSS